MKRIFLFLLLLPLPVEAGSAILQKAFGNITYLHIDDRHRTSKVWSGQFSAINGDSYQLNHFYQSQKPQMNMRLGMRPHESKHLRLALPMHFDNGYQAELYNVQPFFGLGLTAIWAKSERITLSFQLHDPVKTGGKVTESPCYDGLRRSFHCGTGLPWSDAQSYLRESTATASGQFNLQWRF